jgi:hypothetical protein
LEHFIPEFIIRTALLETQGFRRDRESLRGANLGW